MVNNLSVEIQIRYYVQTMGCTVDKIGYRVYDDLLIQIQGAFG